MAFSMTVARSAPKTHAAVNVILVAVITPKNKKGSLSNYGHHWQPGLITPDNSRNPFRFICSFQ